MDYFEFDVIMSYTYGVETVRGIILGTIEYRKCPTCEGTGYTQWDEDGKNQKPGNDCYDAWDDCEFCNSLGFILREKD